MASTIWRLASVSHEFPGLNLVPGLKFSGLGLGLAVNKIDFVLITVQAFVQKTQAQTTVV